MRPTLPSAALAVAALVGIVAGCEAIVPADVATPSCSMTQYVDPGNGTCPKGMYCEGAGCKACESKDFCDGYDNDCDGIIDDGPYSDKDGDGYTYCGKLDPNTGALKDVDCNDDNPKIYPGGDEVCNGKDDNCDGIIDNPDLVCPANETCVPQTGQCISNASVCVECSTSNVAGCCASPNVCDPGTQQCVPNGTQDAGTSCSGNVACSSGICTDPAELGPTPSIATCTTTCCTTADCERGSVCWGAGTGGNYCVPASSVGRTALGGGSPGASCSTGGDCASGVCTSSVCEDTCCTNADCSGGTTCAVTTIGSNTTLACTKAGSTTPNHECSSDSSCASGYCANYCTQEQGDQCLSSLSLCAQPCCSSTQCGSYEGNQFVCEDDYYPPLSVSATSPPASGPVVPVCDAVQATPNNGLTPPSGKVGDSCTQITDCYSNICIIASGSGTGYCSDVCCKDTDCALGGAPSSYVCRPTQQTNGTYLRCIPNPSSP